MIIINNNNNYIFIIITIIAIIIFDSQIIRCSICESLRSLAHSNYVNFFCVNHAALRAVLKPENMSSSAKTTQNPRASFVCTLPISFYRRFQSIAV